MSKRERIIVYVALGVAGLWLLILTVIVAGELQQIDQQLLVLAGDAAAQSGSGGEENWWGEDGAEKPAGEGTPVPEEEGGVIPASGDKQIAQVGIANVRVLTNTICMTVSVRAYGAGDLLFEPPVLMTEEGQTYRVQGQSLEAARIAFLDLVTQGQATAGLAFAGRLSPTEGLWLVFNPNQEPTNAVAPPLRVAVPIQTVGP